jgi:CBS domain containing-hemolysin-like protein
MWEFVGIIAVIALVALNGFFVAAEFSLVAVRRTRIEELQAQGVKRARVVLATLEHLDHAIAATQLGITLSSLALGWIAENALAKSLLAYLHGVVPPPWEWLASHAVAGTLIFLFITFVHVVFGELVPKTMALQAPERLALWVAAPLHFFELLTRPLILLMNSTGNFIARLIGFKPTPESHVHSAQELSLLIEDTEEAGMIDSDQAEILQNVFALTNKTVREVMVPLNKMDALELSMPPDVVMDKVRAGGHTRMPVYQGDPNNIVGVVNTKDLFFLFTLTNIVVLEDAMYPAVFLKPDEQVANAMRLFRKAKRHMALVRDEEGKIHGLLTLEDILEELIGDIEDEQDVPQSRQRLARKLRLRKRK